MQRKTHVVISPGDPRLEHIEGDDIVIWTEPTVTLFKRLEELRGSRRVVVLTDGPDFWMSDLDGIFVVLLASDSDLHRVLELYSSGVNIVVRKDGPAVNDIVRCLCESIEL